MADYISTLQGSQMDAALIDMAEHNSEAWAVGERNGIAVDSSDVAYHNNARYYAQQAQSIAPASVTEAVRWDVAQTALTDAQRTQARDNINATAYNYNILDNSWFTLNSRGQSSYTGNTYAIDRWKSANSRTTVTVNSGYVNISTNSSGNGLLQQPLVNSVTGTVTYSAYVRGTGTGIMMLLDSNGNAVDTVTIDNLTNDWKLFVGTYTGQTPAVTFRFHVDTSTSYDIRCAKLENGSVSTLAYDTPPDYGEELTRCIYSTADPTDTYANNGFGRTNPNLLDNPWFTNPINQRGVSGTLSSTGYFYDRWKANTTGIVITSGYITLPANGGFRQYLELGRIADGKTYTLSVMASDGNIYTMTGTLTSSESGWQVNKHLLQNYIWAGIRVDSGKWDIDITSTNGVNIKAVKLELGSVSTLANDVPPDYGTELAKCQRYFYRISGNSVMPIGAGYTRSTYANILVDLPVAMEQIQPLLTLVDFNYSQGQKTQRLRLYRLVTCSGTNSVYLSPQHSPRNTVPWLLLLQETTI